MDSKKRNLVIAIMVAMFLGAVEGTVISTAIPTIVKDLKGFNLISSVVSVYLLTSAIATPIYGKFSDLYGRKNTLTVGIVIFLIGSSLCGISKNMYELIAFRALQGIGAGAIFTVTFTIIGDVFTLEERAKVQGWVSSVWGIASLAGPFLGGFLIDSLSWHWIFFINLPFGILSIWLLQRNLVENFEKKKHKIDYAGAFVLSSSILSLLYALSAVGKADRNTILVGLLLVIAIVLSILFYRIEMKASEPILSFEIFTKEINIVNGISFLTAAVLIGADVYITIYTQNVLGCSATISGLSMAPMSISWILSSTILSKAIPKYGERIVTGVSVLILLLSCTLLPTLGINSPLVIVLVYTFIMGFGLGGAFTTLTIVVQSSVEYDKRGVATASNSLVRTLGETIGISIFGGLFNASIIKYFNNLGIKGVNPKDLYSTSNLDNGISISLPSDQIIHSLNSALKVVFISLIIISCVSVVLSIFLTSRLKEN